MTWVLLIVGGIAMLVAVAFVIGLLLPRAHIASRSATYKQTPENIWTVITDVEAMTSWRSELKSIARLPDVNGKPAWKETSGFGELPLAVTEWEPPNKMVTRITDEKLPFGGTWTYELTRHPDGTTTLRITERGEVRAPLFRFMARVFFGHTSTMETYLRNLGKKFGETVEPVA